MKDRLIKAAIKWVAFTVALLLVLLITANILIRQPGIQTYLLQQLSQSTGYDVTAERIFVSLRRGPSLHAMEVLITNKDGSSLSIPELYLSLDGSSLLSGRLVPNSITLISPRIRLTLKNAGQDTQEAPGYAALLLPVFNYYPVSLSELSFENATIAVDGIPAEGRMIKGALYASQKNTLEIRLGGTLESGPGRSSFFSLSGILRREPSSDALPLLEAGLDLTGLPEDLLKSKAFSILKQVGAHASVRLKTSSKGGIFFEGSIKAKRLLIALAEGDKQLDVAAVGSDFSALLDENGLAIPSLSVTSNGVSVDGQAHIGIGGNNAPSLRLSLSSPPTSVASAREVVPGFLYPDLVNEKILPIVSEGTVRLERLSLDGSLDQIRHLEENPSALLVKLSWSDVGLMEGAYAPAMSGISGELLFEKGELYISGLRGAWKGSSVDEASMHLEDVYGASHRYRFSGHADTSMKDLALLSRLSWFPEEAKEAISWFSPDRGALDIRLSLLMESTRKNPSIERAEIFLKDCTLTHRKLPFEADIRSASAFINKNGEGRFSLSALSMDSSVDASGSFKELGKTAAINADLNIDPEAVIKTIFPESVFSLKAAQRLRASLNLTIKDTVFSSKGSLHLGGISARFLDIAMTSRGKDDRLDFSFNLEPGKGFLIENAALKLGSSSLGFRMQSDSEGTGNPIVHLTSERFLIEDMGLSVKEGASSSLTGVFAFDTKAELPASLLTLLSGGDSSSSSLGIWPALKEASLTGLVEGSKISIPSGPFQLPIKDGGFILRLSDKGMKIDHASFQIGASRFTIKGDFRQSGGIKGEITLSDGFLNISDFISKSDSQSLNTGSVQDLPADLEIGIKIESLSGLWRNVSFGPLTGTSSLKNGRISIERLSGQAGQCEIDLNGEFNGRKTPLIAVSATLKADNKPAGDILSLVGLEPEYIEGPINLSSDFSTHGDKIDDLLCHLNGYLELEVGKGVIRKSHVLLSILKFLSIEKISFVRPPDLSGKGLYFEGIQGAFKIENGSILTEDLIMQSSTINVAGTGSLDLKTGAVKAEMAVQPFGTLDAIADHLPLLGYILTGKDGTLLIYYFHVDGHIKEPSVSYVPFKNLGSSTLGILHRIILTPGRIFKKLSPAVQSLGKGGPLSPDQDPERAYPR